MNACSTHCCPVHGCKYGLGLYDAKECPIQTGAELPSGPLNNGCEQCAPRYAAIGNVMLKSRAAWTKLTFREMEEIVDIALEGYFGD